VGRQPDPADGPEIREEKEVSYKENPKTKGSGVLCAIPQGDECPVKCEDCFFQSGRSFLEPLADNLPNMPDIRVAVNRVIRINDGNDSNNRREEVVARASQYQMKFFNTSMNKKLDQFPGPVVLTLNPSTMTDTRFHVLDDIPSNLMFVRIRTNTWNLADVVGPAVEFYTSQDVPVVLTFMAYFKAARDDIEDRGYIFRKRTTNSYWAISTEAWEEVMRPYRYNKWVYSCGKIEGERGTTSCRHCGNCLREYFATMERIRND
jgi:hypothetical protein